MVGQTMLYMMDSFKYTTQQQIKSQTSDPLKVPSGYNCGRTAT
jgi:hypothetical protein